MKRLLPFLVGASLWASPAAAWADSRLAEISESDAAELILRSVELLGLEYRYGGSTPSGGLDCSGFIRHIFQQALGLTLPRRSDEMSQVGTPLRREQLRPGDLVFFNTLRRPFSHVGLYVGGDRFVHAPSTGNVIRIEPMTTRYWMQRFEGGRRVPLSNAVIARDLAGLDRLIAARSQTAADSAAGSARAPEIAGPPATAVAASAAPDAVASIIGNGGTSTPADARPRTASPRLAFRVGSGVGQHLSNH